MDAERFDRIARIVGSPASRRHALRALVAGALAGVVARERLEEVEAARRCPRERKCGKRCCPKRAFCCDPKRGACCADGDQCCNPGAGTGTCCAKPNRCGKPIGDDGGDRVCCPNNRQSLTTTGLVRCCPPGTRALEGITAEDGPCCPEEKFCGTTCCGNLAPVCVDPSTELCCTRKQACGDRCCPSGQECINDVCEWPCPAGASTAWCSTSNRTPCGASGTCSCMKSTAGKTFCASSGGGAVPVSPSATTLPIPTSTARLQWVRARCVST